MIRKRTSGFPIVHLLAILTVIASVVFTPSSAAEKKGAEKKSTEVKFSHKRGFYDHGIDLTLSTAEAGAEIRFTTDGSVPTPASGTPYSQPIQIQRTTILRAASFKAGLKPSDVKTHTLIFPADVIRQSGDGLPPVGFPYSWGENKVDYGMDQRVADDPKYREEIIPGLKSIPTFSLVMELDDLFHKDKGIYANAQWHGRDAEKPASLELIHADGKQGFQENCGIRIRGGFSRMPNNAKHGFRVFFRKQYGEGRLKYPLFGEGGAESVDGFDLRTSQNYSWSMGGDPKAVFLRDELNRDTQLAMGQPGVRGDACHLYINGQYWGLYNTCERPEASFAASYFGGKKEDYDTLKARAGAANRRGGGGDGRSSEMPFATDGNTAAWKRLYEAVKSGVSSDASYQRLLGNNPDGTRNPQFDVLLNPVNLIDYMLVILYGGNLDSPIAKFGGGGFPNNWFGSRNRKSGEGFRFFIWDAEHTLLDVNEDATGPYTCGDQYPESNPQWIWQRCLDNAEFRMLLADRIHRHFFNGGVLTPKAAEARFLKRIKEIEKAVICESARWGDAEGGFGGGWRGGEMPANGKRPPRTRDVEWRGEVNRIVNEYFPKRSEVVLAQLWNMGVHPDLAPAKFSRPGGSSLADSKLTMEAPEGTIYFTSDGSDPRLLGGKISPTALPYRESVPLRKSAVIKARVLKDGDWSPLTEVAFTTP